MNLKFSDCQTGQWVSALWKKLCLLATLAVLVVSSVSVASGQELLRVILIGGQSNADGRAPGGELPAELQSPQTNVPFYYYTNGAPPNSEGTLGLLTTLRPGATQMPTGGFGPEVKLGHDLSHFVEQVPGAKLAIIKYAKGGSTLVTDWKANGNATTNGDGVYYRVFQQVVRDGLGRLGSVYSNSTIEIAGMVWVQGENDIASGPDSSLAYGTNLTTFIKDVRQTFCPTMPFCMSRISVRQTFYSAPRYYSDFLIVRSNQLAVASTVTNTYLIDTDDTNFTVMADHGHFDAAGQQALGAAFAAKLANILQLQVGEPSHIPGNF